MTDQIDDGLPRIDGPRLLDQDLRARLERTISDASAIIADREPDDDPARWMIDGPRELPPHVRARLEATVLRPRRAAPVWLTRGVAAATALILVTSSLLVASRSDDRNTPPPIVAAPGSQPTKPASLPAEPEKRPPGSLQAFGSSSEFLRYVRAEALKIVGPYGLQEYDGYGHATIGLEASVSAGSSDGTPLSGVAPPAPPAAKVPQATTASGGFSTTNVQEVGVDEPDLVKTDGSILAVLSNNKLWLLDVEDGTPDIRGSIKTQNGTGIFLLDDQVVVIGSSWMTEARAKDIGSAPGRNWTKVTVIDIADPTQPHVASSLDLEGGYVGARLAGGVVRLILRSGGLGPAPVTYEGRWTDETVKKLEEANKEVIRDSAVGDWMPHFSLKKPGVLAKTGHLHDWRSVSKPPERAGLGMTTVLTLDPTNLGPDEAESVIGAGETLYASQTGLYVTSSVFEGRSGRRLDAREPITRIHKFDISDPTSSRYVGSGWVPGYLLNQFSMSEHEGFLRVASTLQPPWGSRRSPSSVVTILEQDALKLARVGKVGNLGKGEQIYAVRFMGDKGYVVTFRQVDPLYVLDLSTPSAPKVLGELKIPGYSAYLHPIDEDLLIGVGRQANNRGITGGVQLSLFDVSDPSDPRRLDAKTVGRYAYSEVEHDHHGFLYWHPKRLLVVPTTIHDDEGEYWTGAVAVTVGPAEGFGNITRLTHMGRSEGRQTYPSISRSLVVNGNLLTVSDLGVLASDLDTLDDRRWVALRA